MSGSASAPPPAVCSADASAAFASISSLHIGIQRNPAGGRTLFSHSQLRIQIAHLLRWWEMAYINACPVSAAVYNRTVVTAIFSRVLHYLTTVTAWARKRSAGVAYCCMTKCVCTSIKYRWCRFKHLRCMLFHRDNVFLAKSISPLSEHQCIKLMQWWEE